MLLTFGSIIAVTGLGGHAYGSWRSPVHGDMWLRDFLPHAVPSARIFTFGYDSTLQKSSSMSSVIDFARRLLEHVHIARSGDKKVGYNYYFTTGSRPNL